MLDLLHQEMAFAYIEDGASRFTPSLANIITLAFAVLAGVSAYLNMLVILFEFVQDCAQGLARFFCGCRARTTDDESDVDEALMSFNDDD